MKMKTKLQILTIILLSMAHWGHAFVSTPDSEVNSIGRVFCPQPRSRGTNKISAYRKLLAQNNIIIKSPEIKTNLLEDFLFEFKKFPVDLKNEMIEAGIKIHLIQGLGVAQDPTWFIDPQTLDAEFDEREKTFDGRSWQTVPGSSGTGLSYAKVPTRIVVNRLYDRSQTHGHGSINLFLHEHAHSLDSLTSLRGISQSETWQQLLRETPRTSQFLLAVCGQYCVDHSEEAFAELFAYYYGCSASRNHMTKILPEFADYFKNLRSVKKMLASPEN